MIMTMDRDVMISVAIMTMDRDVIISIAPFTQHQKDNNRGVLTNIKPKNTRRRIATTPPSHLPPLSAFVPRPLHFKPAQVYRGEVARGAPPHFAPLGRANPGHVFSPDGGF